METPKWCKNSNLNNFIEKNYFSLSFIDLIRLIKSHSQNSTYNDIFNKLEISPNLTLGFPISDIESIIIKDDSYKINTNFLALYGVSSPLPAFYTEELFDEMSEDKSLIKDFYNIFNQEKYKDYFNASIKYKLSARIIENKEIEILSMLYSFIGENHIDEIEDLKYFSKYEMLKYSNILFHTNKSKTGLIKILEGLLDIKIKINEFIGSYKYIDSSQYSHLSNKNSHLGWDIHLGDKVYDICSTFEIVLLDLDKHSYTYFQKGMLGYLKLQELINLYLGHSYNFQLKYELDEKYKNIYLGDINWSKLGINSWLN